MGRVRTKTVKRSARLIVERFYPKLGMDFHMNKRVTDEVAVLPSKRMRNKIAGFITHLMRRIERGSNVRGVSLKLQEEERERKMDYVPEVSEIRPDNLYVDADTKAMLEMIGKQGYGSFEDVKLDKGNKRFGARGERTERGERRPRAKPEAKATTA